MRKIFLIILFIFMLTWSYDLFVDDFINLEKPKEEPFRGLIKILDVSKGEGYGYNHQGWLKEKIDGFEKANPGIYIETVSMEKEAEIKEDMEDMPDIVPVDLKFPDFNILESLDDYFIKEELDGFKHQVLKPLEYEKDLKAIPIAMSTYVMYINLEKFNEKGVSPPLNGSWTYEEFVDSMKKLTYSSKEDEVKEYGFMAAIGLENYSTWGIILSDGAEIINNRRMRYNFYGEKAIKGLERLIDLKHKHKIVPSNFGTAKEDIAWNMFYKEQNLAAYITGSWAVKTLDKSYKDGEGFNFDLANYPIGDKGLPVVLNDGIVAYGIIDKNDVKKSEACVEFLKYLTKDSNQKTLEQVGLFTVKRGIKDMYKDNIIMKKIEESLDYTEYIPLMDNWEDIELILSEEIKKAILGDKASYEAIEDAKIKIDDIYEK